MKITKSSPVLQSVARKGNAKYWQCYTVTDDGRWFTQTSWWQELAGGGLSTTQFATPYECKPKNIGKKNEMSAEAQALSEFNSIVKKQIDKGYHEFGKVTEILPLPMLAQKFKERKHKLTYPVYVQPKYNGMRMLYDGTKAWSRGGKLIIPEVIQHLRFNTTKQTVDGELILQGNPKLQVTMKAAKKYRPGISEKLLYTVYDVVLEDRPFSRRLEWLQDIFWTKGLPENVVLTPTYTAQDETEVMNYHRQFVKEGYEGIIIRNNDEGYCIGQRSNQLQKYKDMQDAEFLIVGIREGEGSYKGCAVFQCENKDGKLFECNPEGTLEYKQELYKDRINLLGKYLTIRFQEYSSDFVPLFPVGVEVRTIEDFS
jgi:ATP-dependent DNA ligase